MTDEIKVYVFKPADRKFFHAQWADPVTGRLKTVSTKKEDQRGADRFGARLQDDLNEGKYRSPQKVQWEEFRKRYENEVLPGLKESTCKKIKIVLDSVEKLISPARVVALDTEQISLYASMLRTKGSSENTIKGYLGHIRAALRWAKSQKMIHEVPRFKMPSRTSTARRRAVTDEEFDRIVEAVPNVTGDAQAGDWIFFLQGLWWSGLRLGEALSLTWDDPSTLCLNLSGRRPLMSIPPEGQKNAKATTLPIAPEFYELLMTVQRNQRTGKVFNPVPTRTKREKAIGTQQVGKLVSRICKTASVKTSSKEYASAHDFRRSFGVRWSKRVMPATLQKMMRHSSIQTTMQYYAVEDATSTADAVWESFTNTPPNTSKNTAHSKRKRKDAST